MLNDQAAIALAAWLQATGDRAAEPTEPLGQSLQARLAQTLRDTQGGRNLRRLGLERGIDDAAAIDRFSLLPLFDRTSRRIRPLSG